MGQFIEKSRIDEDEYIEFSVCSPEEFINMLNNDDDFIGGSPESGTEDTELRAYEEFR